MKRVLETISELYPWLPRHLFHTGYFNFYTANIYFSNTVKIELAGYSFMSVAFDFLIVLLWPDSLCFKYIYLEKH